MVKSFVVRAAAGIHGRLCFCESRCLLSTVSLKRKWRGEGMDDKVLNKACYLGGVKWMVYTVRGRCEVVV